MNENNFVGKKQKPIPDYKADAMRLLGLNTAYENFTKENINQYLISSDRINAYKNIDTSTGPRALKIKEKMGIASEFIKNKSISEDILKNYQTVYLGSGTDIEYPLTLGCRKIMMVDYILESSEALQYLANKIKKLINQDISINNKEIVFPFDFGEGAETVTIKIETKAYVPSHKENDSFMPPSEIGLVLGFASQGPQGRIEFDDSIRDRLVNGGAILNDNVITKKNSHTDKWEDIRLGRKMS